MVRKLILFLLCSLPAAAQFTTVSATIHDPTGLPYANGTVLPTIVCSASPRFLSSGFPYAPPTQPSGLDSKGTYVQNLADVNQLTPAGCTWNFHVCSAAGTVQPGSPITAGPVCFDVKGLTITGISQDISTQLNAAAPPLANLPGTGGGMTWPTGGAGIPNYSGSSSWGTTYNASNPIPANFIFNPLNQSTTGNAGTATAFQTSPTICPSGQFAQGILASGNATGCAAGGGGGATLPNTTNILAGNGTGGAVDTGVAGQTGYVRAQVLTVSGAANATPFTGANGSLEWETPGSPGAANGAVGVWGHSGAPGTSGDAGVQLWGDNVSDTNETAAHLYEDCEIATPSCTFTDLITVPQINLTGTGGAAITSTGGALPTLTAGTGGLGISTGGVPSMNLGTGAGWIPIPSGTTGVTSINTVPGAFTFTGTGVSCASTTCTFTGGTGSGTVSPNNGVANAVATYGAAAGSTTVGATSLVYNNATGALTLNSGGTSAPTLTPASTSTGPLAFSGAISIPNGTGCSAPSIANSTGGSVGAINFTSGLVSTCSGTIESFRFSSNTLTASSANLIAWGSSAFSGVDTTLSRAGPGVVQLNNGTNAGETGYFRSANSCAVVTPVSFTTTPGLICNQVLPAIARNWIVHCVVPWQFTAGTGTGSITFIVNFSGTPLNPTWFTGVLWPGSGPSSIVAQMTTGAVTLSLGSQTVSAGATFTTDIDGVISAPAAGGTFSIGATTSTGTGSMMAGSYCRIE